MGRKRNPRPVCYTIDEQELITRYLLAQLPVFERIVQGVTPFECEPILVKQVEANKAYARHAIGAVRFLIDQVAYPQYHLAALPKGGV